MKNARYSRSATLSLSEDSPSSELPTQDLFSCVQGMTGYTGQLSSASWNAIFPQANAMNEIIIPKKRFASDINKFHLMLMIQRRMI